MNIFLRMIFVMLLIADKCFSQILPEQVMKTANSYLNHEWAADSVNIHFGRCGGKIVETPWWVTPGKHKGIPYCWGGSTSLTAFNRLLIKGKSAGDKFTKTVFGAEPNCAVGVDCSGFLSRCYGLNSHYSTKHILRSTQFGHFPDFNLLNSGDFVHKKEKHVRLVTKINRNGTVEVIEAGSGIVNVGVKGIWKVFSASYSASKLFSDGYTAQYYKNVIRGEDTLDCSFAVPLTCGVPYQGSSSDAISKVMKYGCGWSESGPERIHKITTARRATITATISDFKGDLDVFILGSCNNLDCRGKSMRSSAIYKNAPAGTYYIVVDSDDGSGSSYTLTVKCR